MYFKNRKITIAVSDFDGTIIKPGTGVPPKHFFETVTRLMDHGIPFVAASGRQYYNLRLILAPIADRIDYIAENGCLVIHNDKVIYKKSIPWDLEKELLNDLAKYTDGEITVSGEKTMYVCTQNKAFVHMMREGVGNDITVVDSFDTIQDEIIKTSIFWKTGIPKEPEQWFHDKYDDLLSVANGGNGWLDFNPKGGTKGSALRVLSKHIGIPTSEMIAFGDNENDIEMLKEAGISYAVTNALPHVKNVCDHICENVEDVMEEMLDYL